MWIICNYFPSIRHKGSLANLQNVFRGCSLRIHKVSIDEAVDFLEEFDGGEGALAEVVSGVGGGSRLAVGVDCIAKAAVPPERVCRLHYFDSCHISSLD